MKKISKFFLVWIYLALSFIPLLSVAQDDPFVLIPKWKGYQKEVVELGKPKNSGSSSWRTKYNEEADGMELWDQLWSGIMNRNTILMLLNKIVIFIANSALVVGAAMVIYAWYLYTSHVFSWADASTANNAIKYAIIGIVVVIFSYTILRFVLHAFL